MERAAYLHYSSDVREWLGGKTEAGYPVSDDDPLTTAVEQLWDRWKRAQEGQQTSASGREVLQFSGGTGAILWRASADRLVALEAGPLYVKKVWLMGLAPLLDSQGVRLTLVQAGEAPAIGAFETRRAALPWTAVVANAAPGTEVATTRRRLLLSGLALLLIVISVGSYFVARAATRELALARLQSDFVAAVSHEFRTPLTLLTQVNESFLDSRVTDPAQLRTYYQAQARATDRLKRLVESLLDLGRMEAGRKPYRMETLDAAVLVRSVVDDFKTEPAVADYTIESDLDVGASLIEADRDAVGLALRNLLDNAVKYSPECRTIRIDLTQSNGRLAIAIRDQGIGIPREEQKEIFRKFTRGTAAKANGIKGTGVGLAMVDHIIRAHGGEIQLQSEPGKGSTFTILLPLRRHAA